MNNNEDSPQEAEFTPLEKIEQLYQELSEWYGEADKKQQRIAAKLLLVALDKFAAAEGPNWHSLVMEYVNILKHDPERFIRIMESNRGELKGKDGTTH